MARKKTIGQRKSQEARTSSLRKSKSKSIAPRNANEFFARPKAFQEKWIRATQVVSQMRANGISLRKASREAGIDPRAVATLAKSSLKKGKRGRYAVTPNDKLLRVLALPTRKGVREVALRDSRQASVVGKYWDAVQKYLRTGDESSLKQFRRKRIVDTNKKHIRFITDADQLDRLANAGVLSFESIYGRVA
jgi:hypothetical protein